MDAVMNDMNRRELIDILECFIQDYDHFLSFLDDAPHQTEDNYYAQRQELMERWISVTEKLKFHNNYFVQSGLQGSVENVLSYDARFRDDLSAFAPILDLYPLHSSLRQACMSLLHAIARGSASQNGFISSGESMRAETDLRMSFVYASPEVMRQRSQPILKNLKPYPITHAVPSSKADTIPMGCVYASPSAMDSQPYIEEVYGSPDMIARSTPTKPIPTPPPLPYHNAAFCQYCGMSTKLEVDIDETIQFCRSCGRNIPLIAKFCPFCGHNTRASQPSVNSYTPPAPAPAEQPTKNEGLLSKLFKRGR